MANLEDTHENFKRRASDFRLDRIETKLDQVADALQTLARTEEKILNMNQRIASMEKKMEKGYDDHIKLIEAAKDNHLTSVMVERIVLRLDQLEANTEAMALKMAQSNMITGAFERGFWVVFTGIIGSIIYFLKGG